MPQAPMVACPKCGAKVRKEKLRRHVNNVHGEGAKVLAEPVEAGPARPASTVRFPWRAFAAMGVVALVVIAGYWFLTQQPQGGGTPPPPPPPGNKVAVIVVANYGTIKVTLDPVRAPLTVANFVTLANEGRYGGNSFHRVVAGFVIQGGEVPGADTVPWEFTGLLNSKYSIAMARVGDANEPSSKDTATSQFFINLAENRNLDRYDAGSNPNGVRYEYVVFGKVTEGQAYVDAIGQVPVDGNDRPLTPVTITSITIQG